MVAAKDEFDEDFAAEVRALAVVDKPRQSLTSGLGALAAMSDEEFNNNLAMLDRGQARLEEIVKRLLKSGEDYGTVPGISKPFLHLPGAEKLEKFYGFAVRQEAERVIGERATIKMGDYEGNSRMDDPRADSQNWLAPPLAYHVRSYVHLRDFDGPVIDVGFGEANVWEEKYRYRNEEPTCPECGRSGLIKRKSPPNLAGKWNCPNWGGKGGCNRVFEPNDERIKTGGKVENTDPWSLAETILLMASKRSFVHGIRRATGTSGYFTQDEDSPSVRQQSEGAGPQADEPEVKSVAGAETVARGGKTAEVTQAQIAQLSAISKAKDIGPTGIANLIGRLFKIEIDFGEATERSAQSQIVLAAIKAIGADKAGRLLYAMDTGDLGEMSDAVAEATYPDDIGAK